MKRYMEWKATQFLDDKLDAGHHELVYGLAAYWGSLGAFGLYGPLCGAAWSVQQRLKTEFGYQVCPSCHWTTDRPHNHSAWCIEQQNNH